jgi:hypothetical protein
LGSNTHLLVADSKQWRGATQIGLLVVDGDHSFSGVLGDTWAHWKSLAPGGIALYHDALPNPGLEWRESNNRNYFPGVHHVVQFIISHGNAGLAASAGSSQMLIKAADLPPDFVSACTAGFQKEASDNL